MIAQNYGLYDFLAFWRFRWSRAWIILWFVWWFRSIVWCCSVKIWF